MTPVVLVKGTWHGEWADPGSPFRQQVLQPGGFEVYHRADWWSGDVSGLPKWLSPFTASTQSDWKIGGDFLAAVLAGLPFEERNVISHSHGLSVCAFAAKQVPIHRLIDICGPIRKDMLEVCTAARKNIGYWVHVASKGGDQMQFFGEMFDGAFGWVREHPCAHMNVVIPGIGHSGLLYDQKLFPVWEREQLLAYLTTPNIGGDSWVS